MEQVKSTYGANDKLSKSVYHILLTCLTVTDSVDDRLVEEEAEKHKTVIFLLIMVFIIKLMSQPIMVIIIIKLMLASLWLSLSSCCSSVFYLHLQQLTCSRPHQCQIWWSC